MRNISLKMVVTIGLFLVLLFPGCNSTKTQASTQQTSTTTLTSQISQTTGIPPLQPISVDISFPNGAPSLNQTAQLKCVVKSSLKNESTLQLVIALPDAFQLISGDLSWQGVIPRESEIVAIDINIKSIKTGNWTINLYSHGISIPLGGYTVEGINPIYIQVMENEAKWGTVPPWAGPTTFPTWDGTTTPIPPTVTQKPISPVTISLATSSLPQINVPFNLNCTISSKHDGSDINVEIKLPKGAKLLNDNLN